MKKQETGKSSLKWILLACGILAVAAAAVLAFVLGGGEPAQTTEPTQTQPQQQETAADDRLYWNVEKVTYSEGTLSRMPRSDGMYYIRFAVDGEQIDLPVKDRLLVSFIDTLEVMGLVFDENGTVVGVRRVEEFAGYIAAEDYYVVSYTQDSLVCNALGNKAGLTKTLKLTADTRIYGVDPEGTLLSGLPGQLEELSKILAVCNDQDQVTHIFAEAPFKMGDVYWNISRQYDSATGLTKRTMDVMGRFEYQFAVNGEQVTLYTKDEKVANAIDKVAAKCMGLVFDEDGYIIEVLATKKVTGNSSFGSWYYVMNIDGSIVSAKKYTGSNKGSSIRGTVAEDCVVYDVSGTGSYVGEPTELRQYDQIHGLKNPYGEVCVIFVVSRTYQSDIYWNVSRQWDSAAKSTKRIPGADGYYSIKVAVNGEQITVRTQDKALVDKLDSLGVKCFGLELDGDVIKAVHATSTVWGGKQFCSWDNVVSIADGVVTAREADKNKPAQDYVGPMAKDCNVYNVSSTAGMVGERTTLQVGDKIHALKNLDGEITHIFVVTRRVNANIYWNLERKYDSAKQQTTRTPNEDGYYEFALAYNGEVKVYKTRDRSLANQLDAVATKCFGLYTSGDIITRFFLTTNVAGGDQFCSWDDVTAIDGSTVTAKEMDANKAPKNYVGYLSGYTKVINVSGAAEIPGEKTTVQVGDKIHALMKDNVLTYVFVVEREIPMVEKTAFCDHCAQEVTWYSWDGLRELEHGKHYYLNRKTTVSNTAYIGSAEDAACEVVLDLCGFDVEAKVRAFRVYGTLWLYDSAETDGTVYTTNAGQAPGFYIYDNGTVNMYGGNFVDDGEVNTQCGLVAAGLNAGSKAVFNMYGGSLQGGTTVKDGGNVQLYRTATMNLYGGSISGGVTGTDGGNISVTADATLNLYGGSITGGSVHGAGTVNLHSQEPITVEDLQIAGKPITVDGILPENSSLHVTLASGNGPVTGATQEENLEFFSCDQGTLSYQAGVIFLKGQPDKVAVCDCCGAEAQWYIWDGSYAITDGHYYLAEDITLSGVNRIEGKVCLDLCGKNISGAKGITDRLFRIYGTMNLTDSAEIDGVITTARTSGQAPIFYVYENATFNMYGGTIQGTGKVTSTSGGGLGGVDKGTMNLYGGSILGGQAVGRGGNIALYNTGTLNIYGGQIADGASDANGGNISMAPASKLNLYGGSITGGEVYAAGKVKLYSDSCLTVDTLYLPGGKLLDLADTLAADSVITLILENGTGVFAENTLEENKTFFRGGEEITFLDGKLAVGEQIPVVTTHSHCVCGGLGAVGDHADCQQIVWTPWPGVDSLVFDGSVSYYLTESVSLATTLDIPSGGVLNLCLNGKNITGADRVFAINGTLNLTDCAEQPGEVTSTKVRQAPVFYVRDGGVFNLYGGVLRGTKKMASDGGLGVIGLNANGGAKMNLYGGTITGGSTSKKGGNIHMYHDSVLTVYGGLITGGTAEGNGGNISMSSASRLIIRGGEIQNGVGASGGNILLDATNGAVQMYGGTVTGTTISGAGANLRISAGTFTLYGGTVTGGTTTNGNGGSIFVTGANAVMQMYGGTVSGGTANSGGTARHGGNIYVASNATLKIVDDPELPGVPTVSNGTATANNGGNIYYGGKLMILDGALITGGSAPGQGQNVYIGTAGAALKGNLVVNDEDSDNVYVKSGIQADTSELSSDAQVEITTE